MMTRRILFFLGGSEHFKAGILKGFTAYARPEKPWTFRWTTNAPQVIPQIRQWRPDAILASVENEDLCRNLLALGVPVVDVLGLVPHSRLPLVTWDRVAAGRLAARHFLDRGLREFGFLGLADHQSEQQLRGYAAALDEAGYVCHVNRSRQTSAVDPNGPTWQELDINLGRWAKSLPRPTGVFVSSDGYAIELLEICRQLELHVPEDLAVLGCDNEMLACSVATVPLSSINLRGETVGYEAARLIDQLVQGKPAPDGPILLPPSEAVMRESTDLWAIKDPLLVAAMRFIREHASEPINVESVVVAIQTSRRDLERRFRRHLGHTALAEIHRARVERAKAVLENTEMRLPFVAERAGFTDAKQLTLIFKKQTGLTPLDYRRQFRLHE